MLRRVLPALAGLAWLLAGCGSGVASPSSATPGGRSPSAAATARGGAATGPEVNPAGDIPDSQVFVPYTLPSGAFTVDVPQGWARSVSGGAVTFTDHFNSVRLETAPASAAPTVASARSSELPAIRQLTPHMTSEAVSTVSRAAGTAVLITYQADSPPNEVTGRSLRLSVERYELWRGGTEAILTLSGPVGADNVDPWRRVTDSFRWR